MKNTLRIYHLDLKVAMFQISWLKSWFWKPTCQSNCLKVS